MALTAISTRLLTPARTAWRLGTESHFFLSTSFLYAWLPHFENGVVN